MIYEKFKKCNNIAKVVSSFTVCTHIEGISWKHYRIFYLVDYHFITYVFLSSKRVKIGDK